MDVWFKESRNFTNVAVIRLDNGHLVADSIMLLQKVRSPDALQATSGHDRNTISQNVCFVHEVSRQNHCTTCHYHKKKKQVILYEQFETNTTLLLRYETNWYKMQIKYLFFFFAVHINITTFLSDSIYILAFFGTVASRGSNLTDHRLIIV